MAERLNVHGTMGVQMLRHLSAIGLFAIACGLLANMAPAQAAFNETSVSATGKDANDCTRANPCKTFQRAHDQTTNSGAIHVLSPGNFGPLTITKAISIIADGNEAVINTPAGGAGIKIQACGGCKVSLRGLTIDVTSNRGIVFLSGAALHVRNSTVRKPHLGILFAPASGTGELYVADSTFLETTGAGIEVRPTGSGGAKVMLDRVRAENGSGIGVDFVGANTTGSIVATVRDSVLAGNTGNGILAFEGGSGTTKVMVDRTASVNNGAGIHAFGAGATIRIGDSTVTGNNTGLLVSPFDCPCGVIESYGTNKVDGNTADVSGTITPVAYK